jgi:hypothetical protein
MLNIISILIGLLATLPILFALLPLLGWANWLILPLPVVGLLIGSLSSHRSGRNFNLVLIGVAVIRLMLGGGIF